MNVALSHVLGATIQTALLNNPLVVIVGWGLGKTMNLNFELFEIIFMILAIVEEQLRGHSALLYTSSSLSLPSPIPVHHCRRSRMAWIIAAQV